MDSTPERQRLIHYMEKHQIRLDHQKIILQLYDCQLIEVTWVDNHPHYRVTLLGRTLGKMVSDPDLQYEIH